MIPHIRQTADWDCGIACVCMVLKANGVFSHAEPFDLKLLIQKDALLTQSVWTIDLAYLLKAFNLNDFTYYTTYIGVNFNHFNSFFYNDCNVDSSRVHSLFAHAIDKGIRIIHLFLSLNDIKRFLMSKKYVVIMLINLNAIKCVFCNPKYSCLFPMDCFMQCLGFKVFTLGSKRKRSIHNERNSDSSSSPSTPINTPGSSSSPLIISSTLKAFKERFKSQESIALDSQSSADVPPISLNRESSPDGTQPINCNNPDSLRGVQSAPNSVQDRIQPVDHPKDIHAGKSSENNSKYSNPDKTSVRKFISQQPRPISSSSSVDMFHECLEFPEADEQLAAPTLTKSILDASTNAAKSVFSWFGKFVSEESLGNDLEPLIPPSRIPSMKSNEFVVESPIPEPAVGTPTPPGVQINNPAGDVVSSGSINIREKSRSNEPHVGTSFTSSPKSFRVDLGGVRRHMSIPGTVREREAAIAATANQISLCNDFVGHYVVFFGYNPDEDLFYYRDPGIEDELCAMKGVDVEYARSGVLGSDDDVIVVRADC